MKKKKRKAKMKLDSMKTTDLLVTTKILIPSWFLLPLPLKINKLK